MSRGTSSAEKEAKRAAAASARQAEELRKQTELEQEKQRKEREKSYRLLARSQRAAGGGYFEQDNTKLG